MQILDELPIIEELAKSLFINRLFKNYGF